MLRISTYLSLALLAAASAPAAPPVLLSDINTNITNDSSYPGNFYRNGMAVLNGLLVFIADDGIHGAELWVSDGTDAGTHMLMDIYPGPTSSTIAGLVPVHTPSGDVAYFSAFHPVYGSELWRTDGTEAGTHIVLDAIPGTSSINPQNIVPLNGGVVFTGFDTTFGFEPWISDGTAAGTHVLLDIYPGVSSSSPTKLASAGDKVFFSAYTSGTGSEPWVTDGTAAGTRMLTEITPGIFSTSFLDIVAIPGRGFFSAYDPAFNDYRLWTSDGTGGAAGTVPVLTTGNASLLGVQHVYAGPNFAVCEAYDRNFNEYRIYRTDGTPAGTSLVTTGHITFTYGGEQPAIWGDSVYLTIDQDNYGYEPWRISQSPATSYRLADIAPGFPGSYPNAFTAAPSGVYFLTGLASRTLYFTDGTQGGTHPVSTTPVSPYSGGTGFAVPFGNTLFFSGDDSSHGVELWRTDGVSGTATLIKDIKTPRATSAPTAFAVVGDRVSFAAFRPDVGRELFATTPGAGDSVTLVKDLAPGPISSQSPSPASSTPSPLITVGSRLFLRATDTTRGNEVWVTDGAEGGVGTTITRDINPGTTGSLTPPGNVFVSVDTRAAELNGVAFFPAATATEGWEIWKSDGTEAGTVPLLILQTGTASSTNGYLTRLGARLYFVGVAAATGSELWSTDGSAPGTAIVADLVTGTGSSGPANLVAWGGNLYFSASVGATGRELYISDGTQQGTRLLADINPTGSSNPATFVPSDNFLFFLAETSEFGRELYRTDGAAGGGGTIRLTDIAPGPDSGTITQITEAGPLVFFTATDQAHGRELWVSDGTVAGTRMVADINLGPDWSDPNAIVKIGPGRIAFSAFTPATGYELWESDGTEVGTRMVGELAPGLKSSFPQNLFLDAPRNRILLSADDQTTIGRELYAWPIPPHCPCDLNADGQTTLQDLFTYLELYFSNRGDITGDAQTTIGDIFAFLACWFQGC